MTAVVAKKNAFLFIFFYVYVLSDGYYYTCLTFKFLLHCPQRCPSLAPNAVIGATGAVGSTFGCMTRRCIYKSLMHTIKCVPSHIDFTKARKISLFFRNQRMSRSLSANPAHGTPEPDVVSRFVFVKETACSRT